MRGITSLAGLLLCLTFGDVAAQTTYRLQPGDTLQVWIAQEPELTREVVIAPDGWLSFPLAGHIQSAGLSVSELEAQLFERLKTYFNDSPNLTIMLRPNAQNPQLIYVLGEVATPGAYPYRANMTVLHGLSVAGGVYRAALLAADQDRSVVVKREVEHSQKRLQELRARIIRLEAEMRGENPSARLKPLRPTRPLPRSSRCWTPGWKRAPWRKKPRPRQTNSRSETVSRCRSKPIP